jgi:hypothetical protein
MGYVLEWHSNTVHAAGVVLAKVAALSMVFLLGRMCVRA